MDGKLLNRLRVWRAQQARKEGVEAYRVLPNATLDDIARVKPLTPEAFFSIKGIKEGRWMKYGSMLLNMVRDSAGAEETSAPAVRQQSFLGEYTHTTTVSVSKFGRMKKKTRTEETALSLFDEPASAQALSGKQKAESLFSEQAAVNEMLEETEEVSLSGTHTLYTVSAFLEAINVLLNAMTVRVKGEVSSVDKRDRVVYFSIKDQKDESVLSCLAFRYHYDISGVALEVGQEIIVEGTPEIYKPTGRFSLKVQSIELAGEGALKKAYDELKAKLEHEGVFAPERKRALPDFPECIALVTSNQGAAIGDFMMNLGRHGFKVKLFNSSVEGKRAVFELVEAVRFFNRHPERYDVLVMIRGGGSLESLQAFNNEALVREVSQSKIPVLAGIGHEKDVSLVALAADLMVSTPTATARALSQSWEEASALVSGYEYTLLTGFSDAVNKVSRRIDVAAFALSGNLERVRAHFALARERFVAVCDRLRQSLRAHAGKVERLGAMLIEKYAVWQNRVTQSLLSAEKQLKAYDPQRILRLGYSLVTKGGRVIRSANQVLPGESVEVKLSSGSFDATVKKVKRSQREG